MLLEKVIKRKCSEEQEFLSLKLSHTNSLLHNTQHTKHHQVLKPLHSWPQNMQQLNIIRIWSMILKEGFDIWGNILVCF